MRRLMGVGKNATIVALLGDMGALPISVLTKITYIRFFFKIKSHFPAQKKLLMLRIGINVLHRHVIMEQRRGSTTLEIHYYQNIVN